MWTRRLFLKAGGVALVTVGVGGGPGFLARAALAAPGSGSARRRKILVTVFQRGAMDGLAAVPFLDEAALKSLRPRLAMSAARAAGEGALLDLGTGFGLHPALAPLLPLWKEKRLAVVHAVGSPDPTRSHFDAQDYMESGTPGRKGTSSGWLNRAVGLLGHEGSPFRAVSLTPALPRALYGDEPALAVTNLADFKVSLPGAERTAAAAGQGFEALYEQTSQELLHDTGGETFRAIEMLSHERIARSRPAAGAGYPSSPLGNALRQIALLVKADVGLEVAFAESGGWDTHVRQGAANGTFARRAADLAQAIHAFWTDLGPFQDQILLTTMTEFGRTVRENGSGGTDHGHGSCLFVLGNQVDGGKVHGTLSGLAPEALHEGRDLPVTTDFRSVFCELAGKHLGIADDAKLFPGWTGRRLPLLRA
ncbi:MAG TPA: DUF1501 domain-containing protein [Thermoanaerobaculia bacterium]|nr:DUF1501 domain-containing protein [Thermoanaerobaculia bacterium]